MKKYGLSLGGGGTKGAYHLGVWEALQKMNIEISHITGTSIGSVNGALFSAGAYDVAQNIWDNITLSNVVNVSDPHEYGKNLLDAKNIKSVIETVIKNDGFETEPFKNMLNEIIDEDKIRNSSIKFGLVTYSVDDLEGKEMFVEDIPKGKLVDYLMASTAMPGLKSTTIDEKKYIDGGVSDNIPANMIIADGVTDIITVDVGGFGVVKGIDAQGINHISIKCNKNIIGHLDFNEENIALMKKMGFFDTLKAFGRTKGEIYSFNISDYHKMRAKYSESIILGIEKAAKIIGIDPYKIYNFDDLKNAVVKKTIDTVKEYDNSNRTFMAEGLKLSEVQMYYRYVAHILNKPNDNLSNKIIKGLMGDIYTAANASIYFIKSENAGQF